jgi:hypothetical protein
MNSTDFDKMNSDINNDVKMNNVFRYKFTDDFTNDLYQFSKIHQYDERKVFKESWTNWVEDNRNIVDTEIRRLTNMNYEGDILEKMFKSARYYFRKKSTEKKEPQQRRVYIGAQKEFLDAMDDHIIKNMADSEYKPSNGFENFCKENIVVLEDEVNNLVKSGIMDAKKIHDKFKKTYKNRYFMLITK